MIEAFHLQKSFGDHSVLEDASFTVEPGVITALVGPNGSGKTTTLHLLAGLTAPDAGTATVNGHDITADQTGAQEELAFLPQDVRFHGALTPRQVLRFYAGLRNVSKNRITPCLEEVALLEAADRPCGTLSGGMRQRLGLALLDLADVPVLLLDEPALSLDPEWRAFLTERLRRHAEEGGGVLMATHLLDVWTPLVDRVLHCTDGRIEEADSINGGASRSSAAHVTDGTTVQE